MTKPISPLRQRMIDDMTIRNMSPNTKNIYISAVARFSAYHRRSPDQLGLEDIRDYHLHLVSRASFRAPSSPNHAIVYAGSRYGENVDGEQRFWINAALSAGTFVTDPNPDRI